MTAPITFTDAELDALLLGLALIDAADGAEDEVDDGTDTVLSARARIAEILPRAPAYRPRRTDTPVQRAILGAIAAETRLALSYVDGKGAATERSVWPVEYDGNTLLAWCERRHDFPHFRADRIQAVEDTGTPMPVRRRVLLAAALSRGEEGW